MEPLPTGGANLTISGVFLEDANDIWVSIRVLGLVFCSQRVFAFKVKLQSFDKVGNKYKQGFVGSTLDLCNFNEAMDKSFAKAFLKMVVRDVGKYIHSCPYQGAVLLEKLRFEGAIFLKILKSGHYRLDFRAYDASNRTYYYLKFFIAISNRY
jgi:Protein of unknown function (DUF1091)